MKILMVASGFAHTLPSAVNAPPEVVLAEALGDLGHEVVGVGHESRMPASGFDICHIHHRATSSLWRLRRRNRPCPVVFTSHSYLSYVKWRGAPDARGMAGVRLFTGLSDGVVCLSQAELTATRQLRTNRSRILRVIGNPVSRDFLVDRSEIEKRPVRQEGIVFVGQLIHLKGVIDLIEAFIGLDDHAQSLTLIYHNDLLRETLQERLREAGALERARFLGARGIADIRWELLNAGLLALPSYGESLPSVVFEALLAGTPVVASDVGGVSEQIGEWGKIVKPGEATRLRAALEAVLGSDWRVEDRLAMSERTASATDPVTIAKMHVKLYEDLTLGWNAR